MRQGKAQQYTGSSAEGHSAIPRRGYFPITATLLISFLIFFFPANLLSQSESYDEDWRWVHFTMESGLPSNEIIEVVETSDGVPWVVTKRGLAWFDGFKWNAIDGNKGLPQKGSREVTTDLSGNIFILIDKNLYYGNHLNFKELPISNIFDFGLFGINRILIIKSDSLFIYELTTQKLIPYSDRVCDEIVYGIFASDNGNTFLHNKTGLHKLSNEKWHLIIKGDRYPLGFNLRICENNEGDAVTSIIDPIQKRGFWEWSIKKKPIIDRNIRGENISCIDIKSNGDVLAVYTSGEVKIRENYIWRDLFSFQMKIRDITALRFRNNNDLWVGTERGLFLYKKSVSRWTFWKRKYSDLKNRVNEILKTRNNEIWLATDGGLEVIYPNGTRRVVDVIHGQQLTALTGLAEDTDGNIWISSGSVFSGAYRWDGIQWKHFPVSGGPDSVQFHKIRKDRQGRLWFLGLSKSDPMINTNDGGAYVLENNSFTRWSANEGLLHSRVYSFAQGIDSALWFGTFTGVSRWKQGSWKHWQVNKELKWGKIFAGEVDADNNFWFANRLNGLCYIDSKDQPQYLTSADGIGHDHIWDIKTDSSGKIWVSTKGGVTYFNGNNQTWSTFSLKSGLPTLDIWPVLPVGNKVYIGTNGEGLAILNLDKLEQKPPRIYLEEKRSDVEGLYLKWKALASWGELPPQDVLTRIKINDNAWTTWSPAREVSMSNLSPGNYTFQIQAKGLFGQYDKQGYKGSFVIPSPWYFQSLFIAPISFLFISVVALSIVLAKRKRAHAIALRRSEANFRTVSETTSSAIFIIRDGRFLYCNSSMIDLSGFEKERFGAFFIEDIIQIEELQSLKAIVGALEHQPDEKFQLELHVTPRVGETKSLLCTFGTLDYGVRPAILGTAVDMTDRRKMETDLRESRVHYEELFNRAIIMQGELGRLSQEVMKVQEDERKRLSRELHDEIGQLLTAVTINLEILKRTSSNLTYATTLNDTARLVSQVFESVHQFSRELRPSVLDELGFVSAIRWYTKDFQDRTGIRLHLNIDQDAESLTDNQKAMLYRVVQESLTNIVKHSRASDVNIDAAMTDSTLIMRIQDNGKGIPADILASDGRNGKGLGILGMRERVHIAKGEFIIDSKDGVGTMIQVQIPVNGR